MTSEDIDELVARGVRLLRQRIESLPEGDEVVLDRWLSEEIVPALMLGRNPAALLRALDAHRVWRFTVAETAGSSCAKPAEASAFVLATAIKETLAEG